MSSEIRFGVGTPIDMTRNDKIERMRAVERRSAMVAEPPTVEDWTAVCEALGLPPDSVLDDVLAKIAAALDGNPQPAAPSPEVAAHRTRDAQADSELVTQLRSTLGPYLTHDAILGRVMSLVATTKPKAKPIALTDAQLRKHADSFLSARERAMCAEMKVDPADYVARREAVRRANGGK